MLGPQEGLHPSASYCSRRVLTAPIIALLAIVTVIGALSASVSAQAQVKTKGRWTTVKPDQWGTGTKAGGTHVALLRGIPAVTDSSWVLHWHDNEDERIWLSKPLVDTFPSTPPAWADVPTTQANNRLFCAGHSALADGRLLVVGGTTVQHTGLGRGSIFDASNYGSATHGWTATGDLGEGRWYPTATTLADGTVLTFSGQRYFQLFMFGGVDVNGTRLNDQHPLSLGDPPSWGSDETGSLKPPGLEGAAAALTSGNGRMSVFGGEIAGGGYSYTVWRLLRKSTDQGETFQWEAGLTPCDTCVWPSPRSRHSASNDTRFDPRTRDTMWVFGGRNANGAIAGDTVWRYTALTNTWTPLVAAGGPPPRYGHTAVWVPGRANSTTTAAQLLVYGGRYTETTLAGDTLWTFQLQPPGGEKWTAIPYGGTRPKPRDGHTAVLDDDPVRVTPNERRVYVFGGEGDSLMRVTWRLRRPESGTDNTWTWAQVTTTNAPSARTRHVARYDPEFQRMLVFGGDTNGSGTARGQTNDMWELSLAAPTAWSLVSASSPPAARAGHVMALHIGPVLAKIPERFTASGSSGSWSALTQGAKYQPHYYPHMLSSVMQSSPPVVIEKSPPDSTRGGASWQGPNHVKMRSSTFRPLTWRRASWSGKTAGRRSAVCITTTTCRSPRSPGGWNSIARPSVAA